MAPHEIEKASEMPFNLKSLWECTLTLKFLNEYRILEPAQRACSEPWLQAMNLHPFGCHGSVRSFWPMPFIGGSPLSLSAEDMRLQARAMDAEGQHLSSPSGSGRATPRNPRLNIDKPTLQEFTKNLQGRLRKYEEGSKASLLFSSEERRALNRVRPDLGVLSSDKWPFFHSLVISGDSIYVDRLLRQNIDVNAVDKDGYSALQRAVLARKEPIVNQLLRAKANFKICDKAGATLLHYSVQTGSMNLVRVFLTCGVDVNSADKYGWTPLHLAVLTGRADIVRLLLAKGADRTLINQNGLRAIDLCFCLGRAFNSIEVAKVLRRF
ncbi:hypothetical protein L7F22_055630 [Adiantum nelumboides]|nr:hypothetical protein [Adiantum nelumboides]